MSLAKALAAIKQKAEQAAPVEWLALYNGVFQIHEPFWDFQDTDTDSSLSDDDYDEIAKNETKLFFSDSAPERSRSILDVSPEIFYEIAFYLSALDLQSLSWTCKPFRHMVMSKACKGLWQGALNRVKGFPPCPDWLCEPQYVALLFSDICLECGMRDAVTRDLYLLVRLCYECQVKLLDSYPTTDEVCRFVLSAADGGICFVLKRDVEALLREVELVKTAKPTLSLEKWERQKKKQVRKLQNRRNNLPAGIEDAEYTRQEEIAEILDTREQEITWRLRGYGWKESDIPFSGEARERWDQLVCKPKHLTSHSWGKLYPKLASILKVQYEVYERIEREERKRERY